MKKSYRIAFLLVFLTSPLMLLAQQVSSELAKQKALTFLTKSDKSSTNRSASIKTPRLVLANDRDEFYVFNDEANGGYVVVSGDERMPDVLGYSYTGHFDAEDIPCNMRAWLEDYANQVIYLRAHPEVPASRRTANEREEISPLLKCHFNQENYYHDKCPILDGEHCYTGCVATAMAQIMYYYQWPKHTTNIIPGYTTKTNKIEMPAIPVTTLDWDNVLEKYNRRENYSDEQIDAISTLMLLCGTSVEMDYDSVGSGASLSYAAMAFRKYFDYNDMVEYAKRGELDVWVEMLYDELKDGRPVLYEGEPYVGSGHAFILDGYKDGYFHVNWGWGGQGDDYFLLTKLNGFNTNQGAVIGIRPDNDDYPSRYAVLDNEKLTLYYDKEKSHRSGTIIPHREDWILYNRQITECIIDPSFANLEPISLAELFSGMWELKSIQGLEYLNTSKALNMKSMFRNCSNLTILDVSGFKTDNVGDMGSMFQGCSSLKGLDVSGFKTDKVTIMNSMFEGCSSLTNLDVSGFKTDNVNDMSSMFYGCSSLTNLDVSGFNTENVNSMGSMFQGCSNLKSLDVSGFKTDKVGDMGSMFRDCLGLTSLDVSGFNTENVGDMGSMFRGCSNLKSIDVSGFKARYVRDMSYMFYDCSNLTDLDLSHFNTYSLKNMRMMFYDCSNLMNLDLSNFSTYSVTDMRYTFYGCSNLNTIYASDHWDMSNVEKSDYMFGSCNSLIGCAGTTYNSQHINGDYAHIDGGAENPGYFTYKASKLHTVTYIVEGEVYMIQTYEYGDSIVMYYYPVRGGYEFKWIDLPETMPDHDIIVMGIYTVNKYKITYMIDGEEYQTVEVEFGSTITPPNPGDREGYDFAWGDYPSTMPAYNIIINGSYTATDIKPVLADESDVKIYTVSGKELNNLQKGVNILRYKDGRTQKLIIK